MVKGSANLCSALLLLAITFAAASDTNISYQIGEINNKLTYLQGRLDLFDYITEGNVSVLQHRVEVNDSKCAENVTKQIQGSIDSHDAKLNALDSKLNALATTVSNNVSKYAENVTVQIQKSNEKLIYLVNETDALTSDVSKFNALESKFDALATTVSSNVSTLLQRIEEKDLKYADNVIKTNVKLNDLEGKLNELTTLFTHFIEDIQAKLLKPSYSCVNVFASPLLNRGSGVYSIQLNGNSSPIDVYCMADPKGGLPWTVVQRRVDDTVDFYRNWTEYQRGFGDLEGNFFIGLEKLHSLTTKGEPQEVWVMLTDPDGISAHAYYDRFAIGNEAEEYPLEVIGKYSGNAGDSLVEHKSRKFSTYDNDNDGSNNSNCAKKYKSAWWFTSCHYCQLNGEYGSTQKGAG